MAAIRPSEHATPRTTNGEARGDTTSWDAEVLTPEFTRDHLYEDTQTRGQRPWTIWDALKAFSLRNLVFALVIGVFVAASGAAIAMKRPAVYSSTTALLIDQPQTLANAKDAGPILKLAVLKVKYADLATSPAITGPAAQSLGLSERAVKDAVVVSAPPTDLLLKLTAQASTRSRAQRIANAVGDSIVNYVNNEQQQLSVVSSDRYRFTVIDSASAAARIQPTVNRALQAAVGLGFIGFLLAYVILQLFTNPRR